MNELDCRGSTVAQTGATLIARYNASSPGERYAARVQGWGPALKMWLLEAGARHDVEPYDGGYRVTMERSASAAQGSIPGVHHVVTDGRASVWACERGRRVARVSMSGDEVAAWVSVASKASHLALSADGKILIVADPGAGKVLALDAASLAVFDAQTVKRIALLKSERYAHGLDLSPDGHYVVATAPMSSSSVTPRAARCSRR